MSDSNSTSTNVTDVVESAKQKTQQQAGEAVEKGRGAVRSQLDQRSTQAGEQAQSLAETLRQTATQLRADGDPQKARFASGAETGADQLERLAAYLSSADADQLLGRLEDLGRRQPYLIAGTALLLGIAGGRFLKASSHQRYYQTPDYRRSALTSDTAQLPPIEPVSTEIPGRTLG
jgi:hypothetical protein